MSGDPSGDFLQDTWRDTQARYDGVRGELPDWIPEHFHREFHAIRSRLQSYSHNDLLGFIAEVRNMWEGNAIVHNLTVPDEIYQEIITLVHFQEAACRGEEAGLVLLTDPDHAKRVTMGKNHSLQQSEKAKKPRGKVSDDGETIDAIIGRLACSGNQDDSAKELWPAFFGELDNLTLAPQLLEHPADPKKSAYQFDNAKGERRSITFGRFENVVSEARKKKKSR